MARFTRRQIITFVSVIYLALLTAFAAYALREVINYSLPIANSLSALTLALPPLAGIALESIASLHSHSAAKGNLQNSKIYQAVTAAFLVYEAVLATLAGTHIAPIGGLWCPLHDKWTDLFQHKNGKAIQTIQDAFNCCGFNGVKDMAFPFQDKAHRDDWCMVKYERNATCVGPWRDIERRVAIIMLVIPVAVFLWKLAVLLALAFGASWQPSAVRLPNDNQENANDFQRPAIVYRDVEGGEGDSLRAEVNRLNTDSNLASHVEGGRVSPSPLVQEIENNMWSREA